MIYLSYMILLFLFVFLTKPVLFIKLYRVFKVDNNFVAGLFASLGISALANKIDYIIYWETDQLLHLYYSILFGIISLLIGLWLFDTKEK